MTNPKHEILSPVRAGGASRKSFFSSLLAPNALRLAGPDFDIRISDFGWGE
jgi:hypothetical protein